ncbi:MAG TPA: 50S ribosomal protein L25, partial [Deltaproteobacteria bacterium]|nr:50S ribosomal protein L25 [Deltaproteobacteria bacterium]
FEPMPVQVRYKDFELLLKKIHGTSMFDLHVEGVSMKALVHSLQRDKLSHRIRHIDFHKVDLKEKVSVEVPLVLVGQSRLEDDGQGVVSQQAMTLHVKCLPKDIPSEIEVDRGLIQTKEGVIHVSDIKLPKGVSLASESEKERILAAFMVARAAETKHEEAAPAEETAEQPAE